MILRRISLDEVVTINALVLDLDRDVAAGMVRIGLLDSAIQAPFAGFGDIDVYPEDWQRLGVLCSRIVLNHPFVDANLRTGLVTMLSLATLNGLDLDLPVSEETDGAILGLAAGTLDEETFCDWVRSYLR